MESVRQIKASPSAGTANTVQASARGDARKVQARGMDYDAGQALFAVPPGPAAPVQRSASKGDAAPVQAKGAETKPSESGGPDGKTLGQSLVGHMDELNKSPALVDAETGKPVPGNNGKYNVGYKPAPPVLPPGAKVVTEQGKEPVLETPKGMDPLEEYALRRQWNNAHDHQNGHVTDVWQEDGESKFFVNSNPGKGARFSWQLKPGASASAALDQWLSKSGAVETGPDGSTTRSDTTVADCASALVAMQLQSLRDRVGDANFDKLVKTSASQYFICGDPKKTPLGPFMSEIDLYKSGDKGTIGDRPLTEGDAVYFRNHTDYMQYDPIGLWSGENCVYLGREGGTGPQMFGGFGLPRESEEGINAKLVAAFNKVAPEGKKISMQDLLANKGGLQTTFDPKDDQQRGNSMGLRLDEAKVKKAMGG